MNAHVLLAYALIAWLAAATPGPAVMLALRNGATHGFRAGLMSTLGNQVGLITLASASVLGLGVILHTSVWLFTVLKWIGAFYLLFLGWRMLRSQGGLDPGAEAGTAEATQSDAGRLRTGVWISLTNPKALLFYGALFPQFLQTSEPLLPQFVVLMLISVTASTSCLLSYAWLASHARPWLSRPGPAVWIHRISGSVFIGFGLLLFGLRRPQP